MKACLVAVTIAAAVSGCATTSGSPALTAAKATRLAELKAAEAAPHHLSEYTRSPAKYDRDDDAWWINYSPKNANARPFTLGFSIEIEDKTSKAWLVLP